MTAQTLRAAELTVVRGGRTILDRVEITVSPGERVAVVGPSGAGKSTLLAALAGLERPDTGTVHLGDTDITGRVDPAVRRRLGIVLQGYGLVSLLTAAENVELPLQARRVPRAEVRAAAARQLAAVGLAGRADHLVEELSGGEQQRVAVARALVTGPDVLFADEPTAELDAGSRALVLDLLLDRTAGDRTLLIATHDPEVAERCDRLLTVSDGRLVA
jgi:predicted ABC-type transport system involved in lysophospholipase L1 biosynthesis ATPase subunit